MEKSELSAYIKLKAKEIGFVTFGITDSSNLRQEEKYLSNYIENGYYADMNWLLREPSNRTKPTEIFTECKSIICLGMKYSSNIEYKDGVEFGKISRYALGKDYHVILKDKINLLIDDLKSYFPDLKCKIFIDSSAILEKAFSAKAGLGWIGKNTLLINKDFGSFFFIGLVLINMELDYDELTENLCGKCSKCIDACPTGALVDPYILDSRKCISYQTIENKSDTISEKLENKTNNWIFGCDICQEVCPYNQKDNRAEYEILPEIPSVVELKSEIKISEAEFKKKYSNTPIIRAKYSGYIRNIKFALENKKG